MEKLRDTAFRAARQAGDLARQRLGKIKDIDYKGAFNIVTDVDRDCEELIVGILRAEFPESDVLAEESGLTRQGGSQRWIIDPLDGTTNYTHSYPFFAVSIGFEVDSKLVFGVVYNPIADEMFWAEAGKGAWLNHQPIHTSKVSRLNSALLATGFPPDTKATATNNMLEFRTLTDLCHGVRRDGAAALDLCFVAAGRLDGFWEMKLSPWDTAAGSIIVREAGGTITNLDGGDFDPSTGHILATNGLIHQEITQVLQGLKAGRSAER